jgi:shikimate kinase
LLRTDNPKERLQKLFEQRQALYLSCADFKIDTGILKSKTVVSRILEEYRAANQANQ